MLHPHWAAEIAGDRESRYPKLWMSGCAPEIIGLWKSRGFPVRFLLFSRIFREIPVTLRFGVPYGLFAGFPAPILFVSSAKHENREFWAEFEDSASRSAIFRVFSPVLRKGGREKVENRMLGARAQLGGHHRGALFFSSAVVAHGDVHE